LATTPLSYIAHLAPDDHPFAAYVFAALRPRRDGWTAARQLVPSDRMLMFLLRHLHPDLFGRDITPIQAANRIGARRDSLGEALAALADVADDAHIAAEDHAPSPIFTDLSRQEGRRFAGRAQPSPVARQAARPS